MQTMREARVHMKRTALLNDALVSIAGLSIDQEVLTRMSDKELCAMWLLVGTFTRIQEEVTEYDRRQARAMAKRDL